MSEKVYLVWVQKADAFSGSPRLDKVFKNRINAIEYGETNFPGYGPKAPDYRIQEVAVE